MQWAGYVQMGMRPCVLKMAPFRIEAWLCLSFGLSLSSAPSASFSF
jgi:hypothetical protein